MQNTYFSITENNNHEMYKASYVTDKVLSA